MMYRESPKRAIRGAANRRMAACGRSLPAASGVGVSFGGVAVGFVIGPLAEADTPPPKYCSFIINTTCGACVGGI